MFILNETGCNGAISKYVFSPAVIHSEQQLHSDRVIMSYVYVDILINLEPIKLFSHVCSGKKYTKFLFGKINDQLEFFLRGPDCECLYEKYVDL